MKFRFPLLIAAIFIMNPLLSQWTDITSTFGGGITANTNMSRPIVCNINNDNYPDLLVYVLTTPTSPYSKYLRLLKNNGNNTFTDVTSLYGLPLDLTISAGFIDFDGDSFKDLYLWDATEFQIYKNNGGTSFTNVSTQLGITTNFFATGEITSGLNVFDYDIDGDEDILYTRAVSGAITFTAIVNNPSSFSTKTDIVTNIPGNVSGGTSASFADVDNDGDFDLIFDASLSGQFNNGVTSLFLKNSNGYTNVTNTSGLPASLPATTEIFDINQDGNLDIIKGGSDYCYCSGPLNRVLIGAGDGTFSDQTATYNIGASWYKGYATHTDIDNDTDFDFSWSYNYGNGAGFRVLSNSNNSPTYNDVTGSLGLSYPNTSFDYAQFGVWLDIDNDGDQDIINNNEGWGAVTSGSVWVKLNPTQGNFLNIKLNGCGINKSGLGARIKVDIGTKTRWLYYEKSTSGTTGIFDDVFHFGLGNATTVSAITVFWPNNTTTVLNNVPGNQNLVITSGTAGTATITPAGSTTICQGGSVVLNANTGTGLTYQWYNNAVAISGATSASYTSSSNGSYTVTVTNSTGCSATSAPTTVTTSTGATSTITPATATTFCQGGSVVLNANTGIGLTYQWRLNVTNITGATSASYTANASGSYTVVVTNTSACSATSTATVVTVNALPASTITAASATTFCQGGSVVLNANTGAGLTYQWRLNGTNITGATSSTYTANASGSYTVVVTNSSSCSSTSTATVVTVNAPPTSTITPATSTTFCQGGSVVLNANTGTGLSYQWKFNGTNISGATSSSYAANASGSYTVVVTNTSTCSATSTATVVTVNALPTATITPATATTFCQGGSVVLNANTGTGLSYQWRLNGTNITGATSSSYTANASGSYTVVVTNTSTCSATSTATVVTVNTLPTATITPATATNFCQGGSVVLNANTGTGLSYQWRLNGTNITGATSSSYTANASGSYTVVVTNTSTCSATSTAIVVTVNALPTATITPATSTTFCQGGNVVLNANTGTGFSYQWRLNGTNITGATSSTYTANASGSYTVVVTNTSTCSATSTATVVTVNALPTETITPATATTFCQGGSVVLNANTGTGLSYQWFNNAVAISGATTSSYTANASGSYTVVVTNTSACSATSTATVVTVNALPTATITPAAATTFCQGGSVVLNANTGTGLTYQWRLNGTNITGATSSSYTASASGSYTVVVTNTSTCSATSSATVVTVNALPTATITASSATTFCQGGSVVLNANTGTGLSYQWQLNGTNITGATTSTNTANASGSYTVVVANTSTCSATSTATVVTVNALPAATITPATATTFCQGGSVVLNANTGTGFMYQWYNNASPINGATSSSYTANTSGSYTVGVTNTSSCSTISSATNVLVNSNTTYFADSDNDGYGNSGSTISTCIQPAGYVLNSLDCNDANAAINAAAAEICNSIDDNCNSQTDEGLTFTLYYADADGDGFGAGASNSLCSSPGSGYSTNALDCNNLNASINPSATELCNNADDNCNSQIDEGLFFQNYYQDFDGDGFGFGSASSLCASQSGYVNNAFDCNDFQAQINPVAQETCNGIDDNCNTLVDDGLQFSNYFLDGDQDGFGSGTPQSLCNNPGNGYSQVNTDCNDAVAVINPSAIETCNSIDDNCNLQIDEGLVFTNYFADNDGDGFGSPAQAFSSCVPLSGMVTNNGDCNDANANINPLAEEIGGNGIDENCDGQIDNSIFELNSTINLYPNPTRSELNIQVNSSIIGNDLYIFDAVGKLVHKQQLLSTQTILPVSNFADGNYVVRVGEVVKRFVVQK